MTESEIFWISFGMGVDIPVQGNPAFRGIDRYCPHGKRVDSVLTFPLEITLNVRPRKVAGFVSAWTRLFAPASLARETAERWEGVLLGPVWIQGDPRHTHNVPGDDALVLRHGKEAPELMEVWPTTVVPFDRQESAVQEMPLPCKACNMTVLAPVGFVEGSNEPYDIVKSLGNMEFHLVVPLLPEGGRIGLFHITNLSGVLFCTDEFRRWVLSLDEPRGLRFISAGYQR